MGTCEIVLLIDIVRDRLLEVPEEYKFRLSLPAPTNCPCCDFEGCLGGIMTTLTLHTPSSRLEGAVMMTQPNALFADRPQALDHPQFQLHRRVGPWVFITPSGKRTALV